MIIAHFALAEASIAEAVSGAANSKPPGKRTIVAMSDRKLAPEPR